MPHRPCVARRAAPTARWRADSGSTNRPCASGGTRFVAHRLEGLHDEPRPGAPRTISDDDVELVIVKTLEETPDRRHALVDEVDGQGDRDEPVGRQPDLAGLRAQAPPRRHLQALARPAVRRKGPRHRRPLRQPARRRPGALRGREVPDPSARPHRPGAATSSWATRAPHPRLRPPGHHQPLRRPRRGLGHR